MAGGKVLLSEGRFSLVEQITRAIDNVTIEGAGRATILNLDGSTAVISAGTQTGWRIRDLSTDAGGIDVASADRSEAHYWHNGIHVRLGDVTPIMEQVPLDGDWTDEVTGEGIAGAESRGRTFTTTPDTGIGTALSRMGGVVCVTSGSRFDIIDWAQELRLAMTFEVTLGAAHGVARITLGKAAADDIGNLVRKAAGIYILNTGLYGMFHNGTDLGVTALLATLVAAQTYRLTMISRTGTILYFLDGAFIGSTAAGPFDLGGADESEIQIEVENGSDEGPEAIHVAYLAVGSGRQAV